MAKATLVKKLRMQPGQRVLILNAPPDYRETLGGLPEGIELAETAEGKFEFVQLFVRDSAQLDELLPTAVGAAEYDGLLWISYPKRSSKVESDLTRDVLWKLVEMMGQRPVSQVSVDDIWSAMRLRPPEKVKTRDRSERSMQ